MSWYRVHYALGITYDVQVLDHELVNPTDDGEARAVAAVKARVEDPTVLSLGPELFVQSLDARPL